MAIDTLSGGSNADYTLTSKVGAASVPPGVYEATAPSKWILEDTDGNEHEIPKGVSNCVFPSKITKVLSAESSAPTNWSRGSISENTLATDTTFTVTVSEGKFLINGEESKSLRLYNNATYTFDQSDASNASDKLYLSLTPDGHHPTAGAVADFEFTRGTSYSGTPGTDGTLVFNAAGYLPKTFYLVSESNSGIGTGTEVMLSNSNDNLLPSITDITDDGNTYYVGTEGQKFAKSTDGKNWELLADFETAGGISTAPEIKWIEFNSARYDNESIGFSNPIKPGDLLVVYGTGYTTNNYLWQDNIEGWTREINYVNTSRDYGIVVDWKIADGTETIYGPFNMYNNNNQSAIISFAVTNYSFKEDGTPDFILDWNNDTGEPYNLDTLNEVQGGSLLFAGFATFQGGLTEASYDVPNGYTDLGAHQMTHGTAAAAFKYRDFNLDAGTEDPDGGFVGVNDSNDRVTTLHMAFAPKVKGSSSAIAYGDSKLCSFDKITGQIGVLDINNPVKIDYSNFDVVIDDTANVEFAGIVTYGDDDTNTERRESLPGSVAEGDLLLMTASCWGNIVDSHIIEDGWVRRYNSEYSSAELRIYTKIAGKNERDYLVPTPDGSDDSLNVTVGVYKNARTVTINLEDEGNQNIVTFAERQVPKGSYHIIAGTLEGRNIGVSLAPENYEELVLQSYDDSNDVTQMIFQREFSSAAAEDPTTLTVSTTTDLHFVSITVNPAVVLETKHLSYQNNSFYAVGSTYAISSNGLSWTAYRKPVNGEIQKMLYANNKYYLVSDSGQIASSEDGITNWTMHESGTSDALIDLFFEDEKLIAVTNGGGTVTSRDGIYWDYQPVSGLGVNVGAASGGSDQVELVDVRAYDGDENRGRFIGTYRIPETAQVGDVVIFNMSWDEDDTKYEIVFEGDSRWQKLLDIQQDDSYTDRGLDMVSYAIRIEEDTDYNVFSGAYITYSRGDGFDIQSRANDYGRVISFQVLRNVGDINDIQVFHRQNTSQLYGPQFDEIEGDHVQLVVGHTYTSHNTPSQTYSFTTAQGYDPTTFYHSGSEFESGRGSMIVIMGRYPNGGPAGYTGYWRESDNSAMEGGNSVSAAFILRKPETTNVATNNTEVTLVGTSELYPYVIYGYSNGISVVHNTTNGEEYSIEGVPYFAEGLSGIVNVDQLILGTTTSGLPVNIGKTYEVLTLSPKGGLAYGN